MVLNIQKIEKMKNLTPDLLEEILSDLSRELKEETVSPYLIPSTLNLIKEKPTPRCLPFLKPMFAILALLVIISLIQPLINSIRSQFCLPEPSFLINIIKTVSILLSLGMGGLCLFKPERIAKIDERMLGTFLLHKGAVATPLQERVLFRIQGLYLIFLGLTLFHIL